jgi:hypothetical protein
MGGSGRVYQVVTKGTQGKVLKQTTKYMGRGQLVDRLAAQVGGRSKAIGILIKRGHLTPDGKSLTQEGIKRNAMSAEERAKDRAAKKYGLPADSFIYIPETNSVKRIP